MAFVIRIAKTIRNNWKKSVFASGLLAYGGSYAKDKYENSFRETPLHYAAFLVEYSVRYSFQNVTYDSENLEIIRYLVPRAKALKDMQCKTALQIVEDTVLECDETEIVASGRYLRDCLEVMKSTEKDFTFIFKLFFLAVKSRDLHSASQFVEAYADPKLNSKAEFVRQLKSFIEEPDLCLLLTIHDKFDHKWLHEYIKSLSRSDFYFEALIHVFSQFFDSPEKQELITKLVREIQHAGVDFASWKLAKKFSQIPTDLELQKILNIFKALFDLRLGVNFNAAAIEFIYSFCSNPTTEPFLIELLLPFTSHIFIDHYCFLDDLNIETYRDDTHQQHLQFFQRLSQLSDYFTLTCCHKLENSSMHFAYRVHSLKHISRNAIRECIFNRRLLTDNEFVESIMRLPIPMVLKKYLRYLDELQFLKI